MRAPEFSPESLLCQHTAILLLAMPSHLYWRSTSSPVCYGSAQDFTTTYSSYFTFYDTILRSYVPLSPFPSFFDYNSATGRLLTGSHLLSVAVFLCHAQNDSLLSIVMALAMPPFLCANRYSDSTSRCPLTSETFAIIATRGVTTCPAPNKLICVDELL